MVRVYRLDVGRLDAPARTPQGGLRAPAYLTRAGVFVYQREDGSEVREYRPADEVFKTDSLATLPGAPVTRLHPPEMVRADNYRSHAVGHVGDNITRDGEKVAASVYVQDGELVSAIERGDMRETSCGYTCDLEEKPGRTDAGEAYDRVQRNIQYNHVAIVPKGRAGAEVRLRLDAAGNVKPLEGGANPPRENHMHKERIDGVDYEVGTDAHKAAVARREEGEKARKAEHEKLQARADAAEADVKKLRADLAEMPKKIAEQAKARAALETGARKILGGEAKLDGMSDAEVRFAVAKKAEPAMKFDGKSEAYIEGVFERAIAHADEEAEQAAALRTDVDGPIVTPEVVNGERLDAAEAARVKMVERHRTNWKKPADKARA